MKHPLGDGDAAWSRPDETAFIKGFEAVNRIPVAFAGCRLCLPTAAGQERSLTSGVIADMTKS
jgi:hypothetical protein